MSKLILLCLLLSSCVSYNVYRVGRHEKIVEVSDHTVKNRQRLYILAKRKADLLGCNKLELLKVTDHTVTCLCIYTP